MQISKVFSVFLKAVPGYIICQQTQRKRNCYSLKNRLDGKKRFDNLGQEFISYELHSTGDSHQLVSCMSTGENTARWALLYKDTFYRQVVEMYYNATLFSGVMGDGDTVT